MNWLTFILALSISAVIGDCFARLTATYRPHWSAQRRLWTAAMILPLFIALLTFAGLAWLIVAGPGIGENMQDQALVVTASIGTVIAVISLGGGFVGALLGSRGRQT